MVRTITVKGVGSVSAKADYVVISMTVDSVSKYYDKAMEVAGERVKNLQDTIVSLGYTKEDLKTVGFEVDTKYKSVKDKNDNYKKVFVGYTCEYRLKFGFDFDKKQLAKVVTAIGESEANPEFDIRFTIKDPSKVSQELLVSATENARSKAEILCLASGCRLGQLISIDYNWGELEVFSRAKYDLIECYSLGSKPNSAPEIEPDDIETSDSATFIWEIH